MTKQRKLAWALLAAGLAVTVLLAAMASHLGRDRAGAGAVARNDGADPGASAGRSWPALPLATAADNPGVRSVAEARATGAYPERLSPLVAPRPFDRAAFDADPRSYLDVVEPGRCFQTGRPTGPDSIYLEPASVLAPAVSAGETVALAVVGAPGAPVTFTAFGPGQFTENTLNSVSVRADARGYAVAHFTAPLSMTGHVPVLVGSPLSIGNQNFLVNVTGTVAVAD